MIKIIDKNNNRVKIIDEIERQQKQKGTKGSGNL